MTVGIICEYNPLHLGHKKQLDRIRAEFGPETTIVCATGSTTGPPADKEYAVDPVGVAIMTPSPAISARCRSSEEIFR